MLLADSEATMACGARLAKTLLPMPVDHAVVVYLQGSLGAGKTTLARGLLRALGITASVRSPTYTLLEPYRTPSGTAVFHLDLYRLGEPEELEMLGFRELLEPGTLLLIEWPQRGSGWLPSADLVLTLRLDDAGRSIGAEPGSVWGERWQRAAGLEKSTPHS